LVDVLRWLDLPALWDESLSAWAVLEALACALLGGRRFPDDPIWAVLAVLDGRDAGARIGEDCPGPVPFHLPEGWRAVYDTDASLLDAPPQDLWPIDADVWIAPHAGVWLRGALPVIRALLVGALADPTLTPDEAIDLILMKDGQLSISHTHVDLTLSSRDADVRLRRAGLDLDPGWVPALGMIVLFHFTE
jgi:hypothetical protein